MANLTTIPLQDAFKTSLAQSWDWEIWTVFLSKSPSFTFPVWNTTYIVVQPNGANPKIAEIDSYNAWANTVNVTNVTLETGAWINNPTWVVYPSNTEVIISDNYQFWSDIQSSINSKVNTETWEVEAYADETARDVAIPTPVNWMQVYVTSLWAFTDYQGWFWGVRATWTAIPNAEEWVAGKVELPTDAEVTAWTAIGWTWATLTPTNAQTFKSISLKASTTTIEETDEFVINNAGEDKRVLTSDLRSELASSELLQGTARIATDLEVEELTATETYIPPSKMRDLINTVLYGDPTEWDEIQQFTASEIVTNTSWVTWSWGWPRTTFTADIWAAYAYSTISGSPWVSGSTNWLRWENADIIETEFTLWFWNQNWNFKFWFGQSVSAFNTQWSTDRKVIVEYQNDTSVKFRTADDTTETDWGAVTITDTANKYKIRYNRAWWEAELYINWVLENTITTNLPTWATMWIGFWPWWGGAWSTVSLSQMTIRVKYT